MSHNCLLPSQLAKDSALRLFCLPYAGGGGAVFHRWREALTSTIELVPLCLPGRDGRASEPLCTDMSTLVEGIVEGLEPCLDRPFALLGHSMGAGIAFELARSLRRRGLRMPQFLVVAACRAPHAPWTEPPVHQLPDDQMVTQLDRLYNGIPPEVRDDEEWMRLLLPRLRADMKLVEMYTYKEEPPLDLDILALGGTEDRAVSASMLEAWGSHTTTHFSARQFPGGHFFLFRSADTVPRLISQWLLER